MDITALAAAGLTSSPAPLPSTRFDGSATMAEVAKRDLRRTGSLPVDPAESLKGAREDSGGADPRVSAGGSAAIGSSNCHISPRDGRNRFSSPLEAFLASGAD